MRVLVATDAWQPQVNGVVRTLGELQRHGPSVGLELTFITPNDFRTMALPGYPEIRLALSPEAGLIQAIETFRPMAVHIVTEGPICAASVPAPGSAIHHELSHPFSGISAGPPAGSADRDLCLAAAFPQCRLRHHDRDAEP
jgi:hypothetical protein